MFRWKSYSDCNMFGKVFIIFLLFTHCPPTNSQDSYITVLQKSILLFTLPSSWKVDIPIPKTDSFSQNIHTPHLYQRRLLSACTWKNRPVCACDEKWQSISQYERVYYHLVLDSIEETNQCWCQSGNQSQKHFFFIISRGCFLPVKFTKAQQAF